MYTVHTGVFRNTFYAAISSGPVVVHVIKIVISEVFNYRYFRICVQLCICIYSYIS